ncbi:hypothetical protein WCLP8_2210019 [uncultured Gammaproteobacteria bacterium]
MRLEPYEGKLSSTVLRGLERGNALLLPGAQLSGRRRYAGDGSRRGDGDRRDHGVQG